MLTRWSPLPTPLVPHLGSGGVREELRALIVDHDHAYPLPPAPFDAGTVMPALRALMWVTSTTVPTLTQVIDPLPPLEFLRTNVSGAEAVLHQLQELATLEHLELVDVKDVDVVDHLAAPLRALEIAGTGRAFPTARLSSVATLETVRLNGISAEVDCAAFAALPDLVELTVLNSRKIRNVQALLDCPKLASITFVNCGNPFKRTARRCSRPGGSPGWKSSTRDRGTHRPSAPRWSAACVGSRAVLRIYFQDTDLARVRVARAPDPLWETVLGLYRLTADAADLPVFAGWQRDARAAVRERGLGGAVGMLRGLVPKAGYFPDFLTPAAALDGLGAGLAAVRDTPPDRLAHDIGYAGGTRRLPTWVYRLASGDRDVLDDLVRAMELVHGAVVRPVWDDVEAAVGAERSLRATALLDGGVAAMLDSLRPVLRWDPPVLSADYPLPLDVHLRGRGLLLIPSYFCWGKPVALVDQDLPPVLVYPVEHPPTWLAGVAGVRGRPLEALLGRTRAAVLAALVTTSTSTELGARLNISTASASEHVGVLRDAGLVTSRRTGRTVRHALTPLAVGVLAGRLRTFRG